MHQNELPEPHQPARNIYTTRWAKGDLKGPHRWAWAIRLVGYPEVPPQMGVIRGVGDN